MASKEEILDEENALAWGLTVVIIPVILCICFCVLFFYFSQESNQEQRTYFEQRIWNEYARNGDLSNIQSINQSSVNANPSAGPSVFLLCSPKPKPTTSKHVHFEIASEEKNVIVDMEIPAEKPDEPTITN